MHRILFIIIIVFFAGVACRAQGIYKVQSGTVEFHSKAPEELISARSGEIMGLIDIDKKTFAFKIDIVSFAGFNSPLQREHFNENYMESNVFPQASFNGKIIEDIDLSTDGTYSVRAKGKLRIHGVERERTIKTLLTVKDRTVYISADFIVALADHNIRIPRVVSEKLAPDISVSVKATLNPGR